MAHNKKGFILYADLLNTVKQLPNDKAGELFKTILEYVNDQDPQPQDLLIKIAFEPIKLQLKRDLQKFEKRVETNRLNGLKGGRPKKSQPNPTKPKKTDGFISKPKKADTDTDTDSDSDIDTDTEKDTDTKKETSKKKELVFAFDDRNFLEAWELWVNYRKEIKKPIKGLSAAQGQQNKLSKLGGGDPQKAVNVIMQSIENNWVGLFDLKTENNGQQTNTPDELKAVVNRLVERHNAKNGPGLS